MISLTYKSSKSRPVDDVATWGIVGLKETEVVDSLFPGFINFHNVAIGTRFLWILPDTNMSKYDS